LLHWSPEVTIYFPKNVKKVDVNNDVEDMSMNQKKDKGMKKKEKERP